jgi:hypothetical protein
MAEERRGVPFKRMQAVASMPHGAAFQVATPRVCAAPVEPPFTLVRKPPVPDPS